MKCFVASYFERFFFSGKSNELDTAVRTCLPGPVLVRSLTLGQPWTGSVGIAWASDNKALWRSLAIGLPEPVFDEKSNIEVWVGTLREYAFSKQKIESTCPQTTSLNELQIA